MLISYKALKSGMVIQSVARWLFWLSLCFGAVSLTTLQGDRITVLCSLFRNKSTWKLFWPQQINPACSAYFLRNVSAKIWVKIFESSIAVSGEECTAINYTRSQKDWGYVSPSFTRQMPACLNKIYCLLFELVHFALISNREMLFVDFQIKNFHAPRYG